MNNKRSSSLDVLRGIGCICVVFMHIRFPGKFGDIVHETAQFAVPIFIMISGYYIYGEDIYILKRRMIKIFRILIFSFLCFWIYNAFKHFISSDFFPWINEQISIIFWIKLIVFCTIDFAIPLWYLISMVETYLFWYFIKKYKLENKIVKMMPLLFLFQFILTIYCETLEVEWFWKTNFLATTLPFFVYGYWIHEDEKRKKLEKFEMSFVALLGICGYVITILPILVAIPLDFSCIGIAFYSFSIFLIAIRYPYRLHSTLWEYIGEKLSLYIYIFHVIVAGVLGIVLQSIISTDTFIYLWIRPILVAVVTTLFSWLLFLLQRKLKFKN